MGGTPPRRRIRTLSDSLASSALVWPSMATRQVNINVTDGPALPAIISIFTPLTNVPDIIFGGIHTTVPAGAGQILNVTGTGDLISLINTVAAVPLANIKRLRCNVEQFRHQRHGNRSVSFRRDERPAGQWRDLWRHHYGWWCGHQSCRRHPHRVDRRIGTPSPARPAPTCSTAVLASSPPSLPFKVTFLAPTVVAIPSTWLWGTPSTTSISTAQLVTLSLTGNGLNYVPLADLHHFTSAAATSINRALAAWQQAAHRSSSGLARALRAPPLTQTLLAVSPSQQVKVGLGEKAPTRL